MTHHIITLKRFKIYQIRRNSGGVLENRKNTKIMYIKRGKTQ